VIKKLNIIFNRGVSIAPLVAFRIIFGCLILFSSIRFIANGWVDQLYIQPKFYFTYLGFDWVHPLTGNWMYLPFALMIVGSVGIILGFFYRFSTVLFFLAFTYVELLDKSNYLNHYYFVSLVSFIMIWLPANADLSFDSKIHPDIQRKTIPQWPIILLKLQLALVYFFAGIAKIHPDWLLDAQPLRMWLQAFRDTPYVGDLLATTWVAYVFSWFGCIYDLSIPFFLSWKRTVYIAYFFVIVFHIVTWILFPIGVFPWVMICSTLIFFPTSFHEKLLTKIKSLFKWETRQISESHPVKRSTTTLIVIFFAIQLMLPFRYILYPGNLFWNEEGYRFSWRVMLMEKKGYATFYIEDPVSKGSIEIENYDYLTPQQIDQMSRQPDMILQFAHHLGKKFEDTLLVFGEHKVHLQNPRVTAEVYVTLNGRPHQLLVGRETDLMKEKYNLKHRTWVRDLVE